MIIDYHEDINRVYIEWENEQELVYLEKKFNFKNLTKKHEIYISARENRVELTLQKKDKP